MALHHILGGRVAVVVLEDFSDRSLEGGPDEGVGGGHEGLTMAFLGALESPPESPLVGLGDSGRSLKC